MKLGKKNMILLLMVVIISIIPLLILPDAEYGGADGEAEEMITMLQPDYEPWFEALWEPPSGEIESLLFALQAAIGTGIITYYLGYMAGKNKSKAVTNS
ncbi:energy-coupling factor ABC transporter substrate-binding protein [Geosporobacter ferrireducens]|uniref:Cobalt transport protein CbiN n=1 Tax=Geosporobacter ferrireducens TaxID=1424294 RepID=A0A1D8GDY7_9FIRM|nr:energy-coupling factor ABC transporter substrate-binding protein [Geosporobacter ferrireducens]AOT69114.1 cobalt ABC transporter substrate-binding protein CbiN [Geosporobacter ferrireducens]MTI56790.1 energy-coupling factor ABC transporter substrate-binding protein [Geosporobacter ferrireducens]